MNELEIFKQKAKEQGICSLEADLDNCSSRKQYIDLCCGSKGLDYICNAIKKGWGIPTGYIKENFSPFINGKYISEQKGYETELYCEYNGDIVAKTANMGILNCKVDIDVPKHSIVNIYATKSSALTIKGEGKAILIKYGDVSVQNKIGANLKIIDKI